MKYLIINTEAFSPKGVGRKKEVTFHDLPWVVQKFLSVHKSFVILDESSKIKQNQPTKEEKKSTRSRLIKLLGKYAWDKLIMTGTLMSKSPVNVVDQYEFLGHEFENVYEFAEKYCVMMTIRVGRGRRVIINQKNWDEIRSKMVLAEKLMGGSGLHAMMAELRASYGIRYQCLDHIFKNEEYTPFMNIDELIERIKPRSFFVNREDIFDINYEKFVKEPIPRPAELSSEAKRIGNELVSLGFTDNFVLGRAAALELQIRLQDVCNGFEPLKDSDENIAYRAFSVNPKIDELMELLDEVDVENNQVVIWSSRKLLIKAITERLEVPYVVYDGDSDKTEAERKFLNKEAQVFIGNQASGAYGLNCLANCNYMIWMCIDGSVEKYHQAMHRILRGQLTTPKFAYYIYAKGSMEERQWEKIKIGQELINSTNTRDVFEFN